MTELLNARQVTKTVKNGTRSLTILKKIDLTVQKGELLAITGKSGSGKSTLLSVLAGLNRPTAGSVCYYGEELYHKNEAAFEKFRLNEIGLVFQDYNLIAELTCRENIEVPLLFSGKAENKKQVSELIGRLGLKGKQELYPRQMSGGEQQRAAIARALVNEPSVLFADEPTGALDSKNAANIMDILKELRRLRGTTVVLVTHDPELAGQCDRKLVMSDGKLAEA